MFQKLSFARLIAIWSLTVWSFHFWFPNFRWQWVREIRLRVKLQRQSRSEAWEQTEHVNPQMPEKSRKVPLFTSPTFIYLFIFFTSPTFNHSPCSQVLLYFKVSLKSHLIWIFYLIHSNKCVFSFFWPLLTFCFRCFTWNFLYLTVHYFGI